MIEIREANSGSWMFINHLMNGVSGEMELCFGFELSMYYLKVGNRLKMRFG